MNAMAGLRWMVDADDDDRVGLFSRTNKGWFCGKIRIFHYGLSAYKCHYFYIHIYEYLLILLPPTLSPLTASSPSSRLIHNSQHNSCLLPLSMLLLLLLFLLLYAFCYYLSLPGSGWFAPTQQLCLGLRTPVAIALHTIATDTNTRLLLDDAIIMNSPSKILNCTLANTD